MHFWASLSKGSLKQNLHLVLHQGLSGYISLISSYYYFRRWFMFKAGQSWAKISLNPKPPSTITIEIVIVGTHINDLQTPFDLKRANNDFLSLSGIRKHVNLPPKSGPDAFREEPVSEWRPCPSCLPPPITPEYVRISWAPLGGQPYTSLMDGSWKISFLTSSYKRYNHSPTESPGWCVGLIINGYHKWLFQMTLYNVARFYLLCNVYDVLIFESILYHS